MNHLNNNLNASPFDLPEQEPCYFCEILRSTEHEAIVESCELAAVLVNARQHQQGQLLVIPRRHAPTLLDLTAEEATAIMIKAKRIADAMVKAFEFDGLLVYQNNGKASGQEVPHFHLHLVPQRHSSSRSGNEPPQVADAMGREFVPHKPVWLDSKALAKVASQIRERL